MPSSTVKQAKVMSAIAHGWHPSEGSVAKIPVKVAKDFHAADAGHKYGKGMHKGDKTKKALRTAKKYASGGKAKSNLIHATEDFRRSPNIEDRRHEDVDRFHDSAYFPPAPVPVFNPSEQSGQLPDALGAFDLDKKAMGFAGGGDVDDNQPDPFAAEKFIAPSVAEQSAKMAGKDVETIKGIGSAIAHTADLPRQALEGSAEDVQHLGEEGYNPKSVGPATEAAMNVIGGAGVVPAEANALRTGVGLKSATANLNSFDRFQQLEANGVKPTQNYTKTGWYRGEDRIPRYWIDDKGARLRDENLFHVRDQRGDKIVLTRAPEDDWMAEHPESQPTLGDIWQHDKLYEAHPWLKNMPVVQHPMKGGVHGYYDALDHTIHINELSPEDFHDTLHHEVVHAIQHEEGFTGGGNVQRFLPQDFRQKLQATQDEFMPIGQALADAGAPIWGIDATAMNRIAYRKLTDLDSQEQLIRATLRKTGLWDKFVENANKLGELQKTQTKAHEDYLHIAGESEARDAPHLRNNPQAIKPYQIPMHLNPEVKRKNFTLGSTQEHWPPPSARWGQGAPGSELPEGFVPDGVYEPKEPYAKGGRVEAEKALPANHQLGMQVPKGGSMCANCKFLASPTTCGNKGFIKWNGKPELPAPADQYCCDLYGHDKPKRKAEGGGVGDDYNTVLSPEDEAKFQVWKQQNMPNDSGFDYDQRGAYLANFQQQPGGHWQDRFKKPNHPTFSDQSQYAVGDQRPRAGTWMGPEGSDQTFVPPSPMASGGSNSMGNVKGEIAYPDEFMDIDRLPQTGTEFYNVFGDQWQKGVEGWKTNRYLPHDQSGPLRPNLPPSGPLKPEPDTWDGSLYTGKRGGKVAKKQQDPKDHEFQDFSDGGLIDSAVPGRTDKHPMKVQPGSYVLPADIPSALGQGNTKAGSEILSKMFTHSAYGLKPMTQKGSRFTYPSFPSIGRGKAEGGRTNGEHVPIIAAGGEYIIHPDVVKEVGNGDMAKGHDVLDKFVLHTRKQHIKTLKGLKGPKQ